MEKSIKLVIQLNYFKLLGCGFLDPFYIFVRSFQVIALNNK